MWFWGFSIYMRKKRERESERDKENTFKSSERGGRGVLVEEGTIKKFMVKFK